MPESFLWLVNFSGSAFTLSASKKKFKQLENTWDDSRLVMKLSASHWCSWALGNDSRIYIYVLASDVPIRVHETTFENQRWSPLSSTFSKSGLWRTDRYAWSDETGALDRPKESFDLPSPNWDWEGDWLIDENLRGEVISREGWQYAVDFPREYFPEKHWNSFVRRRKWIRFRRFSSTNKWAKISDQQIVNNKERFIDVSVGGFLLPSQPAGFLSVWTLTQTGKVYVRTNVHYYNPEGDDWQQLDNSETKGFINISVGATNLVWGINWEGQAVVRTEITINKTLGVGWKLVEYPDDVTRLAQVSVGRNAVWALSRDGQIWFRKGTSGEDIFWSEKSAIGTSWVHMVGQMAQITVSSNDQVFAIDHSYKIIYFRTSVTSYDLTGKTWQPIHLVEDFTSLLRQGLVCEGDICYCGDPANVCSLHDIKQQRTSSTTSSCSNISTSYTDDASVEKLSKSIPLPPAWQSQNFQLDSGSQSDISVTSGIPANDADFLSENIPYDESASNNIQISPVASSYFPSPNAEVATVLDIGLSVCSLNSSSQSTAEDVFTVARQTDTSQHTCCVHELQLPGNMQDVRIKCNTKLEASSRCNDHQYHECNTSSYNQQKILCSQLDKPCVSIVSTNICRTSSPSRQQEVIVEQLNNINQNTFISTAVVSETDISTLALSTPNHQELTVNVSTEKQLLSCNTTSYPLMDNVSCKQIISVSDKSSEDHTDYGFMASIHSCDPVSLFYQESSHSDSDFVSKKTLPCLDDHCVSNVQGVRNEHSKQSEICDPNLKKQDQVLTDLDNQFSSIDSTTDEILNFVSDLTGSYEDNSDIKNDIENSDNKNHQKNSDSKLDVNKESANMSIYIDNKILKVSNHCDCFDATHVGSDDIFFEGVSSMDNATSLLQSLPVTSLSVANAQPIVGVAEHSLPPSTIKMKSFDNLTMAQPRLCWKWLDATSCVIDDPTTVEWLSTKDTESSKKSVKISQSLRNTILKKLWERNQREVQSFKNFDLAINRTTWVKKATMQMHHYSRENYWLPCNVEFEQGISNVSEGCLTVHYQYRKAQKHVQISLSEMTCVKMSSDPDLTSCFLVYTSMSTVIHQPLMLKAISESEAEEWIGYLCTANAKAWNMTSPVAPGSIWSCTFTGDVFIAPTEVTDKKPFDLLWGHHGGHMALVETGPSGVTWGVGFDRMPYVYNKGFGGAVTCGTIATSENIQQIIDSHHVCVYENQKSYLLFGWRHRGMFSGDFQWVTESGRRVTCKEDVNLPSSKWHWTSDWAIDFNVVGGVDTNGWQYSNYLEGPFHKHRQIGEHYRRRRWVRKCKINLTGPWETAGCLGLIDLSIQIDPLEAETDSIVMWAVGTNGDVLYRQGVTINNPLGEGWIHVATDLDKPFKSISVGGKYRVWGIASDGSAWYRSGVTSKHPSGNCWLQVVPPPASSHLLHQVSAGATTVWAVDTGDNLWRRENITSTFPEGTGWEMVASRVKRVSVGPKDQVWVVTDANFCKAKHGPGVIYNRTGITEDKPSGTDWEVAIGSGWAQVSIRGVFDMSQSISREGEESWD